MLSFLLIWGPGKAALCLGDLHVSPTDWHLLSTSTRIKSRAVAAIDLHHPDPSSSSRLLSSSFVIFWSSHCQSR